MKEAARLAKRIRSLQLLRWMRFVFNVLTFNAFSSQSPGSEHEELSKHPLYREAIISDELAGREKGIAAKRKHDLGQSLTVKADLILNIATATLFIVSLILIIIDKAIPVTKILFMIIIGTVLVAYIIKSVGVALSREASGELAAFDHDVRRFIAHHTTASSFPIETQDHVLYLRSFDADSFGSTRDGWLTEEEQLAKSLKPVGEMLAVGRPGEHLPEVGAKRLYFTDAEWQDKVAELINTAELVAIRAGSSPGLTWEAEFIGRHASPDRLLILGQNRREVRRLVNVILGSANIQTPRFLLLRGKRIGSVKGMVTFDANWSVRILPLRRGTFLQLDADGPLVARFNQTLKPVIKALTGKYSAPSIEWASIVGAILSILILCIYIAAFS